MFHRPRGDLQPRGSELVTQEIETPADPADEGLVGVLLKLLLRQSLVNQPDRHPQLPAGRREDHPVVHKPGIGQPGLLHPLVKELQVQRPDQGRERAAQRNPSLHLLRGL